MIVLSRNKKKAAVRLLVLALAALVAPAAIRAEEPAQSATPPSSEALVERARWLVEQLREPRISKREDAVRELMTLAATEDPRAGRAQPVHDALVAALRDPDAEVRFRVRRILCDPEYRVAHALESLLKPLPTAEVRTIRHDLSAQPHRAGVVAGLVRVARRAARAGRAPGRGEEEIRAQEEWHAYGVCHAPPLPEASRFAIALDLLGDVVATADDARSVADLLREDVGAGLPSVIEALAACREPARAALRDVLRDPSPLAREQAALALGEIGTAEDAPALEALLADPKPRVRRAAVTAIGILPLEPAACARAAALASDPDPRVAAVALRLGASRGLRFVSEAAVKILTTEVHNLGDEEAVENVERVRIEAARALGCLHVAGSARALAPLTRGDGKLASYAAWSLGAAGNLDDAGELEAIMNRDQGVPDEAIFFGLARAGAVDLLERIVKTGSADARRAALDALGSAKGDADAIVKVLEAAGTKAIEQGTKVREWIDFEQAFRALRDRNDPKARAAIGRLLDRATGVSLRDGDPSVLKRTLDYAQECYATECVRAVEQLIKPSGGRGNLIVSETAIDVLSTLDPVFARTRLKTELENSTFNKALEPFLARGLARAGDRTRIDTALAITRAELEKELTGAQNEASLRYSFNWVGIDEMYAGHTDEAASVLRRMRWVKPDSNIAAYNIACDFALAEKPGPRTDDALRWLRRSMCEGFRDWRHIEGDNDFKNVKSDPRFVRLIEEMRLEQEVEPAPTGGE